MSSSAVPATGPVGDDFVVRPHHPDRLRRPLCRPERLRADLIVRRYRRSTRSMHPARAGCAPSGAGVARWMDLIEILEDCASSTALTDLERLIACNALIWIERSGIDVG